MFWAFQPPSSAWSRTEKPDTNSSISFFSCTALTRSNALSLSLIMFLLLRVRYRRSPSPILIHVCLLTVLRAWTSSLKWYRYDWDINQSILCSMGLIGGYRGDNRKGHLMDMSIRVSHMFIYPTCMVGALLCEWTKTGCSFSLPFTSDSTAAKKSLASFSIRALLFRAWSSQLEDSLHRLPLEEDLWCGSIEIVHRERKWDDTLLTSADSNCVGLIGDEDTWQLTFKIMCSPTSPVKTQSPIEVEHRETAIAFQALPPRSDVPIEHLDYCN